MNFSGGLSLSLSIILTSIAELIKASDYVCSGRDPVQAMAMILNKMNFPSLSVFFSHLVEREREGGRDKKERKRYYLLLINKLLVLMLDGNSKYNAHVWSDLGYLICLRQHVWPDVIPDKYIPVTNEQNILYWEWRDWRSYTW